jgi:4-hydroxybenzoate polyprenyltransferase
MNAAFFTLNGVISVVFFCAVAADVFWHGHSFSTTFTR